LLAQTGQRGTDTVHLPARRLGQIADRSTVWPLEKRAGLTAEPSCRSLRTSSSLYSY
jgi:hypothetical protein